MIRLLVLLAALLAPAVASAAPIPVKVVVVTAFEIGKDTGDVAGEFQPWIERYPATQTMKVAGIERPARLTGDGVLMISTGMFGRARNSLASLLADPRFDFRKSYWLMAGIAGVDPRTGAIGSAAWSDWVVDGDPLYELDDRETPTDWPYGLYASGTKRPGVKGPIEDSSGMAWKLDPGLVQWAWRLTRDTPLPDDAQLAATRKRYPSEAAAMATPKVFVATSLGTVRFWHGERRTQWARDWVKTWTDGAGVLAMTDGEDQAVMDVLSLHAKEGRVDIRRVLVLRTASNYSREGDGDAPMLEFAPGGLEAGVEAAWRVGSPVVKALVAGWPRYADSLPGAK